MLPCSDKIPESWIPVWFEIFRWIDEDCIQVIFELDAPVRGIYSDRFEIATETWTNYVTDFSYVVLEESGHFLNCEYPDEFNDQLNQIIMELNEK